MEFVSTGRTLRSLHRNFFSYYHLKQQNNGHKIYTDHVEGYRGDSDIEVG